MNINKHCKEIDENGYTIIKNFFNKSKLTKIKNSLLEMLNYIENSKEKDLQKKYYEIKKNKPKLKSNFYDLAPHNIDMLQSIHSHDMIKLVKKYFKTNVVLSGRPAIHIHDDQNDKLLLPHQETNQYSVNILLFWLPLWDTNVKTGGLTVYEKSHKYGYFEHTLQHPKLKKKVWTKKYTHVDSKIYKRFKRKNLSIKAGSAVIAHSALLHCGYPNKSKKTVRIVVTERFNPLKKLPFLQDEKASMKIPYTGVDYNSIKD